MTSVLAKIGMLSVCGLALHFTILVTGYIYRAAVVQFCDKRKLRDYGTWGVVFGADNNIGQAYVCEMAKQGLNVVLVGTDHQRLTTMADCIEKYFQVTVGVIPLNISTGNSFANAKRVLTALDIGILVNAPNYAEGYSCPENFLDLPHHDLDFSRVICSNITTVTQMCAIVMPGMVTRGRGIVINVSSLAVKVPSPLLSVYGASAAYVNKLSEELRNEYSCFGITVQTLYPGYLIQRRQYKNKSPWMIPTTRDYVASAMRRVGIYESTCGYFPHTFLHWFVSSCSFMFPSTTVSLIRKVLECYKARMFAST